MLRQRALTLPLYQVSRVVSREHRLLGAEVLDDDGFDHLSVSVRKLKPIESANLHVSGVGVLITEEGEVKLSCISQCQRT